MRCVRGQTWGWARAITLRSPSSLCDGWEERDASAELRAHDGCVWDLSCICTCSHCERSSLCALSPRTGTIMLRVTSCIMVDTNRPRQNQFRRVTDTLCNSALSRALATPFTPQVVLWRTWATGDSSGVCGRGGGRRSGEPCRAHACTSWSRSSQIGRL